jgi:hypothetical protein
MCASRPGSGGKFLAYLAAIREALACAGGHVAAVERILERKGLVAAAAAGKGPTALDIWLCVYRFGGSLAKILNLI